MDPLKVSLNYLKQVHIRLLDEKQKQKTGGVQIESEANLFKVSRGRMRSYYYLLLM